MTIALIIYLFIALIVLPIALDAASHLPLVEQWLNAVRLALMWTIGVGAFALAIVLMVTDKGEVKGYGQSAQWNAI